MANNNAASEKVVTKNIPNMQRKEGEECRSIN